MELRVTGCVHLRNLLLTLNGFRVARALAGLRAAPLDR